MKFLLIALGILTGMILIGLFIIGRPMKWVFPGDDIGWVTVQFNNPTCPPLHADGIFLVVDVPEQKSLCTSTQPPHGLTYLRFEARQKDTIRRLKWDDSVWPAGYKEDSGWYMVFVGSRDKFNHSGMPRPWRQ